MLHLPAISAQNQRFNNKVDRLWKGAYARPHVYYNIIYDNNSIIIIIIVINDVVLYIYYDRLRQRGLRAPARR